MTIHKGSKEMLSRIKKYVDEVVKPVNINNSDGYLDITGSGTSDVTIDVNYDFLTEDFYTKNETDKKIFGVVSGDLIVISGILDFKNKIPNSFIENPHIAKWGGGATLQLPNSSALTEFNKARYDAINELDGISATVQTATNTSSVQVIRRWNLIAVIERDHPHLFGILGATTTAEKVAIARKFITSLKPSDWSFGSGADADKTKNLIQFQLFDNVTKLWVGSQSATDIVPTKLSYSQGSSTNINYISDDGFIDTISFAPASNGTIASVVNIDYTSLDYTLTISASDIYALKSEVYSKSETDGLLNLKADKTVAQMNKITSDDGRPIATIQTGTILNSVLGRASGMKTYTFTNATADYPASASTSMRGYAYMASASYGYVFSVDISGNIFVRAIVDSAWVGDWQQLNRNQSLINRKYNATDNEYSKTVLEAAICDTLYKNYTINISEALDLPLAKTSVLTYFDVPIDKEIDLITQILLYKPVTSSQKTLEPATMHMRLKSGIQQNSVQLVIDNVSLNSDGKNLLDQNYDGELVYFVIQPQQFNFKYFI